MIIRSAEYVVSCARVEQCPAGDQPEFAFIGRSNVGKSSLINMLTGRAGLAKTSATPGKTVLINYFSLALTLSKGEGKKSGSIPPSLGGDGGSIYFVDLPGYGYAKRGQQQRDELQRMITGYILRREQMMNLFLLIDARHEPQRIDLEFIEWLGENGIPFSIVFTKADKLSKGKLAANVKHYLAELSKQWEELPPHFITSSETKQGKDELLDYIESIITA
ncbi:MAG: YihA family ribosome biogenesis GTP-binding protein [Bacteroidaceae bacterium]|nr:YihA family ribosome biogenesis GTP-binding protein [Bacteroidaceae bacterium]